MWIIKKKKNDTNELTKQKEAHRLKEQTYGCQGGRIGGMDSEGLWGGHVHTAIFKKDNQQGPTA